MLISISPKIIMHLIASNFYGGPENQILEYLKRLNTNLYRGVVVSFLEGWRPNEILERATLSGLSHDGIPMSRLLDVRAQHTLTKLVRKEKVVFLCVHGYKFCVIG